ncbi:MAG: hypothetical protein Q8O30_03205 [Candidatus Omnitrophota bacterium]|nr:hypothetical protein [Candidatus Omnitrophota bacterium]
MTQYFKIPQLNSRIFLYGIILIILISGTLKVNQNIANKGTGYFVLKNIQQANEAGKLGYVKYEVNDYAEAFGLPWKSEPGVRRIIRSGPDDFDDIGYISMLELIALSGKKITIGFLENLHNIIFIISLIILSFIVKRLCQNIFAGWIFFILALLFKSNILSFVYGNPDSRIFTISFPCIAIAIIFLINWLKPQLLKIKSILFILFSGLLIGTMVLVRYSEGIAVLYAIIILILLLNVKFKQKLAVLSFIFVSYCFVVFILPIVFSLHRDIKTKEFMGDLKPYLRTTGNHPAWHSLTLSLGKYPNSLGMKYYDLTCYDIVRARYPNVMHPNFNIHGKGYYDALRTIYFKYVVDHPFEYIINQAKSFMEIFYFIPYATSAGNLSWSYGYLPLKLGVAPHERDKACGVTGLVCLRFSYLKLNFIQWAVFIFALFNIAIVVSLTFFGNNMDKPNRAIFSSAILYLALLCVQRGIIPQHGLTLVIAFWVLSIICLLYILFVENAARYLIYRRWKILLGKTKIRNS